VIKQAIQKIIEYENLSAEESRTVMNEIMSGQVSPVEMSAFLTALRQKGETSEEILGAAQVMREKVHRIHHHQDTIFDNCGTGGDCAGTFNISTTTSFVLAGCGLVIGKHGNRSVSSKCGSADLLQELGVNIDLTPEQMGACIDEIGIGYLFAPSLHPAMKKVAPIRKELGFRTIFNLLGPLTNPAFATHQMIGVFSGDYTSKLAEATRKLGIKKACVVYNKCGIDELTTAGSNLVAVASNGSAESFEFEPQDYGFKKCSLDDLKGGSAKENAGITLSILKSEIGPKRDSVILNAAMALMTAERVSEIEAGISLAAESIDSGRAQNKLQDLIQFTSGIKHA